MMDKEEFLAALRLQLSGELQEGQIAAHIRYYEDYICQEVRKGQSQQEVIEKLGDPRLIAKTLIDTNPLAGRDACYEEYSSEGTGEHPSYNSYDSAGYQEGNGKAKRYKLDLTTWYGKIIVIIAAALILILIFTILSALLPFILLFMVGGLILSIIRKR